MEKGSVSVSMLRLRVTIIAIIPIILRKVFSIMKIIVIIASCSQSQTKMLCRTPDDPIASDWSYTA